MSDTLSIAYDGNLAEVTLTRPDVLNRFDPELHRDFIEALVEVRSRGDVRAMVLASTGGQQGRHAIGDDYQPDPAAPRTRRLLGAPACVSSGRPACGGPRT